MNANLKKDNLTNTWPKYESNFIGNWRLALQNLYLRVTNGLMAPGLRLDSANIC